MRLFLDANILVSVLNKEYPQFTFCARILSLSDDSRYQLYTSPLCLGIAWYFSEKKSGAKTARKKIEELIRHISIAEIDEKAIKKAIYNKKINDFEDGMQYYAALNCKCKYIITSDKDDFYFSELNVMNTKEFLEGIRFNSNLR